MITKLKLFIIIQIIIFSKNTYSQQLARKGSLGIGIYNTITDSIVELLNLKTKSGAVVQYILPNTTAEKIGLKINDLITSVNQKPVTNSTDLMSIAKNFRENESVHISLIRNNKTLILKGKIIGKPIEKSEIANIDYDEFKFKDGLIRCILKTPKQSVKYKTEVKQNKGTIYFIPGITCTSIDNLQNNHPYKNAIDEFIRNGFSVFLVEKSGLGDNYKTSPCEEIGFNEELAIYKKGYEKLLSYENINLSKIFLFGHSLGGVIAPVLATEYKPKGVIVYGTVLRSWHDYLLDVYRIQNELFGLDKAAIYDTLEQIKPTLNKVFYNEENPYELIKDSNHLFALKKGLYYDEKSGLFCAGRSYKFHVELNRLNLAMAWKNVPSYVLAAFGEADLAAMNSLDHEEIIKYINELHPGFGTYLFVPKTNHSMQEVGSMHEFIEKQSEPDYPKYAEEHFNYKFIDQICEWIEKTND